MTKLPDFIAYYRPYFSSLVQRSGGPVSTLVYDALYRQYLLELARVVERYIEENEVH